MYVSPHVGLLLLKLGEQCLIQLFQGSCYEYCHAQKFFYIVKFRLIFAMSCITPRHFLEKGLKSLLTAPRP